MSSPFDGLDVVIGVDNDRDTHIAALVELTGGLRGELAASADWRGYRRLFNEARSRAPGRRLLGDRECGSYGAGLTAFLLALLEWSQS